MTENITGVMDTIGSSQDALVLGWGEVQTFGARLSAQGCTTGYSPAPVPALYPQPHAEAFPALPSVLGRVLCSEWRDPLPGLHTAGYSGPRL